MKKPLIYFFSLTLAILLAAIFFVVISQAEGQTAFDFTRGEMTPELLIAGLKAASIAGIGFAVCAWWLYWSFDRRIRLIELGIKNLARGNLGFLISMGGRDEFSTLNQGFNAMSGSLAAKFNCLESRIRDNETKLANVKDELGFIIKNLDEVLAISGQDDRFIAKSEKIYQIVPSSLGTSFEINSIAELRATAARANNVNNSSTPHPTKAKDSEILFTDAGDSIFSVSIHKMPSGNTILLHSKAARIFQPQKPQLARSSEGR
jgi:methyl-accepting chemotaxis protein